MSYRDDLEVDEWSEAVEGSSLFLPRSRARSPP